jgi:hypothetical protein
MFGSNSSEALNIKNQSTPNNLKVISGGLCSLIALLFFQLLSCGYLPLEEKQEEQVTQGVEVSGKLSNGEKAEIAVQVFPRDNHQELVAEGEGDESISLDVGDYDLLVIFCGSEVWLNDVQINAGEWTTHQVMLNCGTVILHPQDNSGKKVWAFIRVYPVGNHLKPVCTAWGEEPIYLPPTSYDLLVKHQKSEQWIYGVKVVKNQTAEKEVRFTSELESK